MSFRFPAVVDDITVRLTAALVLSLSSLTLVLQQWWLLVPLAVDFVLRAALGPRASPIAQLAARVLRPLLSARPRPVPGAPKRFAATIGAVLTTAAVVLLVTHSLTGASGLLTGVIAITLVMVVFPALEAILGFCVGCVLFSLLMRTGVIPEAICRECADITSRRPATQRI